MVTKDLFDKILARMGTPEERLANARARTKKINDEIIRRNRCPECGVDTINYSHTFRCSWRGM